METRIGIPSHYVEQTVVSKGLGIPPFVSGLWGNTQCLGSLSDAREPPRQFVFDVIE